MARDHARIQCAIWRDAEFTSLSKDAQRIYMLLLSQPNLSLCGRLDYTPGRWANLAGDDSVTEIEDAIGELQTAMFVLVDEDAAEIIIRSFVRHDGVCDAANLIQAMWKAWGGMFSDTLRQAVVQELPDVAFQKGFGDEKKAYEPPREALEMRERDPLPNPSPKGSPKGSEKGSPTPVPSPSTDTTPVVVSPADDDRSQRIASVLADYDLERLRDDRPDLHVGDPARWLESARRRRLLQDGARIREIVENHPTWSDSDCANELLRPTTTSPVDAMGQAQQERIERNAAYQRGEACPDCEGMGVIERDDGSAVDCECKYRRTA